MNLLQGEAENANVRLPVESSENKSKTDEIGLIGTSLHEVLFLRSLKERKNFVLAQESIAPDNSQ